MRDRVRSRQAPPTGSAAVIRQPRAAFALAAGAICLSAWGCGQADNGPPPDIQDSTLDTASPDAGRSVDSSQGAAEVNVGDDGGPADSGATQDVYVYTGPDPDTASSIGQLVFRPFKTWAPSMGGAANDLAVYSDKLYLAYTGDGGSNAPIVAFEDRDDPTPSAQMETSDKAQERLRLSGGDLWVTGSATTEISGAGSVYRLAPKAPWVKWGGIPDMMGAHDVAATQGAVWVSGTAATLAQRKGSDRYARIWWSTDGGLLFEQVHSLWNEGTTTLRWRHLISAGGVLFAFGEKLSGTGQLTGIPNLVLSTSLQGSAQVTPLAPDHPLNAVHVQGSWTMGADESYVAGVDILGSGAAKLWRLVDDTKVAELDTGLAVVLDMFRHDPSGETLALGKTSGGYAVRLTADMKAWKTIASWSASTKPTGVAFWRGHLFISQNDGQVRRANGEFPED